jgi:hypothetical protein
MYNIVVQVFLERDFQHPEQEDLQLLPVSLVSMTFFYLLKLKSHLYFFEVRTVRYTSLIVMVELFDET